MVGEVPIPPGASYSEEESAPLEELVPWEAPGSAEVSHTHLPGPLDLVDEAGQAMSQAARAVRVRWSFRRLFARHTQPPALKK